MATGVASWSQTAATNATADSAVNWAEGQAPSSVNDSARAMMASVAKYRDDNNGSLTTGGTSTAYTVATNQGFASLAALANQSLRIKFNATNGAAATLNVDGTGAKALVTTSGTAVTAGAIVIGTVHDVVYDSANAQFQVVGSGFNQPFPGGTRMIFRQTAAPGGWTKDTSFDNYGLRIVAGTISSGGTQGFTTVLAAGRKITQANLPNWTLSHTLTASHTLTVGITDPGHTHANVATAIVGLAGSGSQGFTGTGTQTSTGSGITNAAATTGITAAISGGTISISGGTITSGGSDTGMNFDMQYVDAIIAVKDA